MNLPATKTSFHKIVFFSTVLYITSKNVSSKVTFSGLLMKISVNSHPRPLFTGVASSVKVKHAIHKVKTKRSLTIIISNDKHAR